MAEHTEGAEQPEEPGDRPPGRAAAYAGIYPSLVEIGREHGYAVAVHGSLARDLDLIATPWVEHYSAPDDFVKDIARKMGAVAGEDLVVVWPNDPRWEPKPHGRLCYTIVLDGGAFIDLSVIPPRYPPYRDEPDPARASTPPAAVAPSAPPEESEELHDDTVLRLTEVGAARLSESTCPARVWDGGGDRIACGNRRPCPIHDAAPPEEREERSGEERRVNTGCSCQRRLKPVPCVSEDRLGDRRTQPNRGRAARRETDG